MVVVLLVTFQQLDQITLDALTHVPPMCMDVVPTTTQQLEVQMEKVVPVCVISIHMDVVKMVKLQLMGQDKKDVHQELCSQVGRLIFTFWNDFRVK